MLTRTYCALEQRTDEAVPTVCPVSNCSTKLGKGSHHREDCVFGLICGRTPPPQIAEISAELRASLFRGWARGGKWNKVQCAAASWPRLTADKAELLQKVMMGACTKDGKRRRVKTGSRAGKKSKTGK